MTVDAGLGIGYNLLQVLCFRLLGYRIVIHHHTSKYLREPREAVAALIALAGGSATHIVLSELMKDDLTHLYPRAANVRTSHNARYVHGPTEVRPRMGPARVLGLLSNLTSEKGLDLAIATCIAAHATGMKLSLVLAGPLVNADAEIALEQARVALGSSLDYRGTLDEAAKQVFFRDIDVFLFPTSYRYEAQPIVLIEAMSFSVPIITRDEGYIDELIDRAGVVVSKDADFALVALETIRRWTDSNSQFEAASKASRNRFEVLQIESKLQFRELLTTAFD